MITSLVQYLCLKEDKSRFKIQNKNSFLENESIIFTAELYNRSFESVKDANINIVFKNNRVPVWPGNGI